MAKLEGVFTAIVTPFRGDGIDWNAFETLIEKQIAGGIHGLVPCGTTGESPTLSPAEHHEVIDFTIKQVNGRVPVVAGTGSNSTSEAIEYTRHAREAGADAALVVLPYYNRPTPDGVVEHFRQIAGVGLPMVVYNIPSRCGIGLDVATYRRLAEFPEVVATKEASGSLALVDEVVNQTRIPVLSGDDSLTFPFMCLGGCGVISVVSNVAPRAMVDLYERTAAGELEAARAQHQRLLPLMHGLFVESNPAPVKWVLARMGGIEEIVRPPLVPVSEASRKKLERLIDECGDLLAG